MLILLGELKRMTINLSQMYDRLASFDTETTGLNVSKSNIWQLGFTNSSISVESEVNPFLLFNEKIIHK